MTNAETPNFTGIYPSEMGVVPGPYVVPLSDEALEAKWWDDMDAFKEPISPEDYLKVQQLQWAARQISFAFRVNRISEQMYLAHKSSVDEAIDGLERQGYQEFSSSVSTT